MDTMHRAESADTQPLPYLALDLGAGSGRAFLGYYRQDRIELEEIHRFPNKPIYLNGTYYWDFLRLWDEVTETLRRCSTAGGTRLAGIGIDTWNVDFGLIDKQGQLLMNPVSYRDQSAVPVMEEMRKIISDDELFTLTGIGINSISALTRLYQMKTLTAPDLFGAASAYLPLADLFRYFLSGEQSGEESILWGSQLLSVETRTWLTGLMERFGLPERLFPAVRKSGTVSGELHADVKHSTGVESAPVITVAEHDTISASLAVYDRGEEDVFLSTGTWSVMGVFLDSPYPDPRAREFGFLNEIAPEGIVFARNMMGFYILEECFAAWKREGTASSYEELITFAEESPPFELFINVNESSLFSSPNMPESLNNYLMKSGQTVPKKPGVLIRGILEGMVYSYRSAVEDLEGLTERNIAALQIIGGGTKNHFFCQMIAGGLDVNVTAAAAEPAVLGNVGMQAIATGAAGSIDEFRRVLQSSLSSRRFTPGPRKGWDAAYRRFKERMEGNSKYAL